MGKLRPRRGRPAPANLPHRPQALPGRPRPRPASRLSGGFSAFTGAATASAALTNLPVAEPTGRQSRRHLVRLSRGPSPAPDPRNAGLDGAGRWAGAWGRCDGRPSPPQPLSSQVGAELGVGACLSPPPHHPAPGVGCTAVSGASWRWALAAVGDRGDRWLNCRHSHHHVPPLMTPLTPWGSVISISLLYSRGNGGPRHTGPHGEASWGGVSQDDRKKRCPVFLWELTLGRSVFPGGRSQVPLPGSRSPSHLTHPCGVLAAPGTGGQCGPGETVPCRPSSGGDSLVDRPTTNKRPQKRVNRTVITS